MKKQKLHKIDNLFHLVIPTGDTATDSEFFDDCELCQQLKRDVASGNAIAVPWREIRFDDLEDDDDLSA